MQTTLLRSALSLVLVFAAVTVAGNAPSNAQDFGTGAPGSVYIPATPGGDGDPSTIEPGSPAIQINPRPNGSREELYLYGLLFLIREISVWSERRQRNRIADAAASRATELALARLARGDDSADPGPGAIVATS